MNNHETPQKLLAEAGHDDATISRKGNVAVAR
jgi:hypothetical protein